MTAKKIEDIEIFSLLTNAEQSFTVQEIRQVSVHRALVSIHTELGRGKNNVTLTSEMNRLEEYTCTIEKLINMQ